MTIRRGRMIYAPESFLKELNRVMNINKLEKNDEAFREIARRSRRIDEMSMNVNFNFDKSKKKKSNRDDIFGGIFQ